MIKMLINDEHQMTVENNQLRNVIAIGQKQTMKL